MNTRSTDRAEEKYAIDCKHLKRTIDRERPDPYAMLCTHIVRDDKDCIGPFLEDIETECGLWEPNIELINRQKNRLG